MDIVLTVPRLTRSELLGSTAAERSADIRGRVEIARERQRARLEGTPWTCNAQMSGPYARRHAGLSDAARTSLADAVEALALSGRGFDRALKVARTLADLEGAANVERQHVSEALVFRAPSHQEPPTVFGAGVG